MKEKKEICFGCGFRKFTPTREVSTFPSTRVGEISLEVDPIEQFRFETETFGDSVSYRLRSDVSMLLHAADLAKRAGVSTAQRFLDSKRSRSSSLQEQLDKLNPSDDELLSMVKSRHLQHPSEILDWVESINELAEDMKSDALRQLTENETAQASAADSGVDSSGTADAQ